MFKKTLFKISEELCNTPGSVDLVETHGTVILRKESEKWLIVVNQNLTGMHDSISWIHCAINSYAKKHDNSEQFMFDVWAVMDEFIYYFNIFCVYHENFKTAPLITEKRIFLEKSKLTDKTVSLLAESLDLEASSSDKKSKIHFFFCLIDAIHSLFLRINSAGSLELVYDSFSMIRLLGLWLIHAYLSLRQNVMFTSA